MPPKIPSGKRAPAQNSKLAPCCYPRLSTSTEGAQTLGLQAERGSEGRSEAIVPQLSSLIVPASSSPPEPRTPQIPARGAPNSLCTVLRGVRHLPAFHSRSFLVWIGLPPHWVIIICQGTAWEGLSGAPPSEDPESSLSLKDVEMS